MPPEGLVLVGPNGHGKTSFLEALLYLEVFRSFRGARERELVTFGRDGFHVAAGTEAQGHGGTGTAADRGTVEAGYDARTGVKRVSVDGAPVARLSSAIGRVRGVVLSPFDVELVAGSPRERRRYLDVLLSLTVPGYVEALGTFARALRQRGRAEWSELPDWEAIVARSGAVVAAARREWVAKWAPRHRGWCEAMGERGEPGLSYVPGGPDGEDALAEALAGTRERDLGTGRSSVGPHRDDLRLTLDGRDLRVYGSAGQQRTAAIALRLVEAAALAESSGDQPAICLDDAFAELDGDRSARLGGLVAELIAEGSQVFATVPRDGEMPAAISGLPRWRVTDGVLSEG